MREDIAPVRFFIGSDVVAQELVNGVVAIRAFDIRLERQIQNIRVLAELPQVRFLPGEAHTMDARLLSCAHTDRLPICHKANRVGLCVLERNPCDDHIADRFGWKVTAFGHDVRKVCRGYQVFMTVLFKGDAKDVACFERMRVRKPGRFE